MALTQVPIELSSTPGIVDNSNATAITIDSSENVGIGITNPSDYYAENLVVAAADEGGITIESGATEKTYLMFAQGTSGQSAYRGFIGYDHNTSLEIMNVASSGVLNFITGSGQTERMRITAAGALQLSDVNSPNDINTAIYSNSDVLEFEAFGTNGAIAFSTGSSVTEAMRILSTGGITFNGDTAQANALDDYEEGTFTPAFVSPGTGAVYSFQLGTYRKVGSVVTVTIYLQLSTVGTGAGNIAVTGLPFATSTGAPARYSGTGAIHGTSWASDTGGLQGLIPGSGSTVITIYKNMCASSSTTFLPTHAEMGGGNMLFTLSYFAA